MAKWTDAQLCAIENRDKTVLVSAAAGSGKTTTLTERIIRRLTDKENPADIGRFLIVTFTKAAAADLKSKISKAVGEALAKDPANSHLSRQMIRLGGAEICTIDSFYYSVVKDNFEVLGLPARLNMLDSGELEVMKIRILGDVIEDFYESKGKDFRAFMDNFMDSRGKDNATIELLDIYKKLGGYPQFLEFLVENSETLKKEANMPFFEGRAGKYVKGKMEDFFSHTERIYTDALDVIMSDEKASKAYGPAFAYDKEHFARTMKAIHDDDYEGARREFSSYHKITLGKYTGSSTEISTYKELRKEATDEYISLGKKFFSCDEATLSAEAYRTADFSLMLYEILSEFDRRLSEEKLSRSSCDFSDNKRFVMKLFIGEDGMPTELARVYSEKYDEIYIDEYQDTDIVQDMIFSAISKPDNRFMVGDIKQSIYRFRGANPTVFAEYKNTFPDVSVASRSMNCAIYMSENFRCDRSVIDATNLICSYLFRGGPNSIGYTDRDDLVCGKQSTVDGREIKKAQFNVIRSYNKSALGKMEESERKKYEGKGSELEVRAVISEIIRLLKSEDETCEDKGILRRIEPRDIAILTRDNATANRFAEALSEVGIPCSARTTVNYFENPEVLLVLSLLNVIDNPQKDVYLAGVLRSPLFGFGIGDLVEIRKSGSGSVSLYDDLIYASQNSDNEILCEKISYFLKKLEIYRESSRTLSVDKLIKFIYSDTSMLSFAGSSTGDEDFSVNERRANLLMLYDYARRYESGAYKGVYSFICYINDIIASDQTIEPPAMTDASNVVSVMTIHNSKGLEFPICFIPSMQKKMLRSNNKTIEFDYDIGLGICFGDDSGFAKIDTQMRQAIISKNESEDLEEEMRVLYVAMTRARERLYMSAHTDSGSWEEKAQMRALYADRYTIMTSASYFEWITTALCAIGEEASSILDRKTLQAPDIPRLSSLNTALKKEKCDEIDINPAKAEEIYSELSRRFDFSYEYSHLSKIPAKLSVSKLYPEVLDSSEADEMSAEEITLRDLPAFLMPSADRATSAQRGTATHTFMQFCDFENAEKNGVKEEMARLCSIGLLEPGIQELINIRHIEKFFASPFYAELKRTIADGGKLYREQRFNIKLPASSFTADREFSHLVGDESIVVQGVIDLVFVDKDGNVTLCDYKTDYLDVREIKNPELALRKLTERHASQLMYYKEAVKRIFGKEPSKVCIYSLPFGDALDISVPDGIK